MTFQRLAATMERAYSRHSHTFLDANFRVLCNARGANNGLLTIILWQRSGFPKGFRGNGPAKVQPALGHLSPSASSNPAQAEQNRIYATLVLPWDKFAKPTSLTL
jgi:hypothetical protein